MMLLCFLETVVRGPGTYELFYGSGGNETRVYERLSSFESAV